MWVANEKTLPSGGIPFNAMPKMKSKTNKEWLFLPLAPPPSPPFLPSSSSSSPSSSLTPSPPPASPPFAVRCEKWIVNWYPMLFQVDNFEYWTDSKIRLMPYRGNHLENRYPFGLSFWLSGSVGVKNTTAFSEGKQYWKWSSWRHSCVTISSIRIVALIGYTILRCVHATL